MYNPLTPLSRACIMITIEIIEDFNGSFSEIPSAEKQYEVYF